MVALAQPAADTVDGALERYVKDQLDHGVPLDAIVKRLADALATQVATALGVSPQAAQQALAQAFSQVFGNATGPPGETNAQRAAALVRTLRQIAEAATRVTNADQGTPILSIAGQRSDADTAKASPTPTTADRLLRGALDALVAPAAPALVTAPTSQTTGSPTVAHPGAPAVATGGDTLLGRTLARAVLADQQRSAPVETAVAAAAAVVPAASALPPAGVVDAFLRAFAGALAQADAGSGGSNTGSDAGAGDERAPAEMLSLRAPVRAEGSALPFAVPFAQHASPLDPALPAGTPAAPAPVDPGAVMDQILRGMQVHTADGQSEVRLHLLPEQLGDVSIKLIVSGGVVDASITADSAAARDALVSGQSQLARTLADAGLKLQGFTVGLGGGFTGGREGADQNPWARGGARRIGPIEAHGDDEPDDVGLLAAVPSFGPPIFTAARFSGHNYLV